MAKTRIPLTIPPRPHKHPTNRKLTALVVRPAVKRMKHHVLFVDDEENIRLMMPMVLRKEGFDVTVAATVSEALQLITRQKFDILLADLNIGEPGDGFTVVSAMRRTQPNASTFILTGYPDFQTALEAIRQQVDDYLTKPADIRKLVETLKSKIEHPRRIRKQPAKRIATVITDNVDRILEYWLAEIKKDHKMESVRLSDKERIDHLPLVLESLALTLESDEREFAADALQAARKHGIERAKDGYNIPMLVLEVGTLHRALSKIVQDSLLEIDVSTVIDDSMKIGENLNALLEQSIRGFEEKQTRHVA